MGPCGADRINEQRSVGQRLWHLHIWEGLIRPIAEDYDVVRGCGGCKENRKLWAQLEINSQLNWHPNVAAPKACHVVGTLGQRF